MLQRFIFATVKHNTKKVHLIQYQLFPCNISFCHYDTFMNCLTTPE
jgi:hypothetical protein